MPMMGLSARLLTLRRSPILLRLPPYLSALCIAVSIAWLLILPLDEYSRETYISENAILPGQVHTYFGGSEHNVFRAYRHEVWQLSQRSDHDRIAGLEHELRELGLKVATQPYRWSLVDDEIKGENVYGIIQGPRADATEAMVLIAAWRNFDGEINYSGVALALTLARYFKRWSIWSKDIIVLIPDDSTYGPEAWVSAYHSPTRAATSKRNITSLPLKAGALQGAIALDYPAGPWGHRFDKLDILYDGINGALPNLDLLNTAVQVASNSMGIRCTLHSMPDPEHIYLDRLTTITKGLITQSIGHATGPHSAFMPYHVDAITLRTVGDGWQDEMSLGKATESLFRSLNNLLEHLHQSFFFYVLLSPERFVSIGNYLPAAMIVAGNFTLTALAMWIRSGKVAVGKGEKAMVPGEKVATDSQMEVVKEGDAVALVPKVDLETVERRMFLPAVFVLVAHLAGFVPLFLLTHTSGKDLHLTFYTFLAPSLVLPIPLANFLAQNASTQQVQLVQSFSLLFLGAVLSTLATINFSLAFIVGLLCSPLSFVRPLPSLRWRAPTPKPANRSGASSSSSLSPPPVQAIAIGISATVLYAFSSPPIVLWALNFYFGKDLAWTLAEVSRGWAVQGVWTSLVVCGVWWPAWIVGGCVLGAGAFGDVQ